MDRLAIYGAVVIVLVIALAGIWIVGNAKTAGATSSVSSTVGQQNSNQSVSSFASEPYYRYSYLVAPGNVSQQAKSALDGYSMSSSQQPNGTDSVMISVVGTSRSTNITLGVGEKLYIVETSMGDDGPSYDGSFADDGFVLVDQDGQVVNTFSI